MKILVMIGTLLSSLCLWGQSSNVRIESWRSGEPLQIVLRNERGHFQSRGELFLESWNDGDDISEWVARDSHGRFITGYTGKLEKFNIAGFSREKVRLVIRNSNGQFVTWTAMDKFLKSGFEKMDIDRDGKKETVYVTRFRGKFVNWAVAKLEFWANYEKPVLVVRDTADGINNGKLLTWVAPLTLSSGATVYRDPESGEFLSRNL